MDQFTSTIETDQECNNVEVPIPMLAMVATAVRFHLHLLISYQFIFKIHVGLNDWSTGKYKSSEWNAEAYNSTYLSNVEFLQESILDVDRSKFHCLMAKLYQLAS